DLVELLNGFVDGKCGVLSDAEPADLYGKTLRLEPGSLAGGTRYRPDKLKKSFARLFGRRIFKPLLHRTKCPFPVALVFVVALSERQALLGSEKKRISDLVRKLYERRFNQCPLSRFLGRRIVLLPLSSLSDRSVRLGRLQLVAIDITLDDRHQRALEKCCTRSVCTAEKFDLVYREARIRDDLVDVDLHHRPDP